MIIDRIVENGPTAISRDPRGLAFRRRIKIESRIAADAQKAEIQTCDTAGHVARYLRDLASIGIIGGD